MGSRPTDEDLLVSALHFAPTSPTLAHVARRVNEYLDVDLTMATWRGIWKGNATETQLVRAALGTRIAADAQGQKLAHRYGIHRIAIVSDGHAPFHDATAISRAAQTIAAVKPTLLVLNGDMIDFYKLSRFDTDPLRTTSLQDELDACYHEILVPLREAAGDAEIIYTEGNHEARLRKYLWTHPEIASLRTLEISNLLQLDTLGITYVTQGVEINGNVLVTHGKATNKWAGNAVRAELLRQRFGISVVMGHIHRVSYVSTWTRHGDTWGIEAGCLCGLDPEYMEYPDWQHGMAVVESSPKGATAHPVFLNSPHPVVPIAA